MKGSGIALVPFRPANCGFHVSWSDAFRDRFGGQVLKNVAPSIGDRVARGDAVVSNDGLEGGPIYALSAELRDTVARDGDATLVFDLFPDVTVDDLATRLARRRTGDSTSSWLRRAGLPPISIGLLRESTTNQLPDSAAGVARLAKSVPIRLAAAYPIDRAISTAGGIALSEVDDAFMLRRRPGTFVAGEMLDWEAPTGGYLLQATFSTAVAAAKGVLTWLADGEVSDRE